MTLYRRRLKALPFIIVSCTRYSKATVANNWRQRRYATVVMIGIALTPKYVRLD